MTLERRARWVAAALGLILLFLSGDANADNLGGLVFVVFIWPIGIFCAILLLILGIIGLVKLRTRGKKSSFPSALLGISIAIATIYPVLALVLSGAFRSRAPADVLLVTLVPVELVAVACLALGLVLRARSREEGA